MRGIGDILSPPLALPKLGIIIVHPGIAMPTPPVFKALGLKPGERCAAGPAAGPVPDERERHLRGSPTSATTSNRLLSGIAPAIADVVPAPSTLPDAGSPACPARARPASACRHRGSAAAAVRGLAKAHSGWWARAAASAADRQLRRGSRSLTRRGRTPAPCASGSETPRRGPLKPQSSACHRGYRQRPAPPRRNTSSSSGKWVNTCVTTPAPAAISARAPAAAPRPGAASSAAASSKSARNSVGRHLGHAAEQALRRPRAHQHDGRRRAHHEGGAAAQLAFALFGPCAETSRHRRARAPRSRPSTGHSAQAGFFGVQIVAPRSIMRLGEIAGAPRRHAARRPARGSRAWPPASRLRRRRAARSTRSTLPSTGLAGRSNAIAAIAAAV